MQEYTGKLYKKDLHDPDNYDVVITHLEADILECEVKGALGSITTNKASGDDGIPAELFQFSCSVMSDSLQSHGWQHARPPCPSPTPRVHPNSCPLSQ